ncbi:MAG: helix-turn-helix domain-containing protein [Nitrospirota bacterium]
MRTDEKKAEEGRPKKSKDFLGTAPKRNDVEGVSIEEFLESRLKGFIPKLLKVDNGNLYFSVIGEIERCLISLVLRETGGNQVRASRILGINRNTLRKKIRDLNIKIDRLRLGSSPD